MSDSLWLHGLQHARPPCPAPSPGVYSNSCPLGWWRHPTISSSVVPFSDRVLSKPASGTTNRRRQNELPDKPVPPSHRARKRDKQNRGKLLATATLVQPAPTGEPQRPLWLPVIHMHAQLLNSIQLSDPMDCRPPGSSVCGISRQEYWSGLPFPSPGNNT